jgi:cobalt-zinc-cadmium efflux system membrane fusion protein
MTNYKLILLLLLIGCNTNEKQEPESTQAANQTHTITQIQLTRAQSVQANIKTGEIGQRLLPSKLETTAEITIDKINTATVSAFSDGIITKLFAQQNQLVQKGSVLATIQKPDLVDLQQQYLANQDRLEFLKTEYERYRSLKEADATATKNYLKAEAEWKAAITIQKTIAAKLRQFHIDPSLLTADNIITEINLKAPISGTISKVLANIGTSLSPGTPVYELTDYKQLHPVLYVFEKDLFNVQKGQTVELILPGEEQKTFQATIYSIERLVDPERKTVKVHARFTTSIPDQLAVGAYLEGKIWINNKKTVPALPKEAIIREDQSNYIFILEKEDDSALYFRKVKVKLGASDANFTAITPEESLPETAKVVLNGAYYISAQGAGLSAEE